MTQVLGSTWYTNLSPNRITLQSPEAGQRVPFETTIGVELAIVPPDWMPPESVKQESDPVARQGFDSKSRLRGTGDLAGKWLLPQKTPNGKLVCGTLSRKRP
jgi:hypothetical protein